MSFLHVGLDIGSTTAKSVVLDGADRLIHSRYVRHFADIHNATGELMKEINHNFGDSPLTIAVAGSGGISIAEHMDIPFTQELVACSATVGRYLKGIDVAIELGGEDAKLTFFDHAGIDQRMNETCAGGTGAFLDQMASLLGTDVSGLNELAKDYKTIYPIASRCGVFAKTDVQPLLNDGAARADIAASILQAIVTQTISGLACGRRITGRVAFLGGPLYFMSELRKRFVETLKLRDGDCIFPENPHLFVAIGAAILGKKKGAMNTDLVRQRAVDLFSKRSSGGVNVLPALFVNEEEREAFKKRHAVHRVERRELGDYAGGAYLGVDVGSTTTKVVLVGDNSELLFSRYSINSGGEPVKTVRNILLELYEEIPDAVTIKAGGVTGYGEKLVQAAFGMDVGEVETVAHAKAAEFVHPGADFVIDIGGQDMKCLGIRDGVIDRVFLNEACSSGCGSFLQSFAESMNMDVRDFAKAAEESSMPVDLGSRCTVFMNSRVRQSQKEGAAISDISAGLVYSVVKNALYKVLKVHSADEIGEKIVVQGGSFKNDALLRAFEMLTGREVVRPQISELMGAFGAALLAKEGGVKSSTLIGHGELKAMEPETSTTRCGGCGNACILTVTKFGGKMKYVSGNRCEKASAERGDGTARTASLPPNVFEMKYARLFDHYEPLAHEKASRGVIGIPRVLNMYENYPFWFTLLTNLGFRVELSPPSPKETLGMDTIPSQTVCYPAKVAHRHVMALIDMGVPTIFYPIIQKESKEFESAHQNFNCPVVTGYPDVINLNIDEIASSSVRFMKPALPMELCEDSKNGGRFISRLLNEFSEFKISASEMKCAYLAAVREYAVFKEDVQKFGEAALKYVTESGCVGVVLAGHPYHLDPQVHHGIPELIQAQGVAVLTEDSICRRVEEVGGVDPLYVVDQWVYHSRLYRAATVLAKHPSFKSIHMVQLNSFGCGLDAISADQAADLLKRHGKLHTLIKIDEGKNNGAVRIRIRSLLASVKAKGKKDEKESARHEKARNPISAAKNDLPLKGRTILCPPLSSHHFQFLEEAMRTAGLDFRVLPEGGRSEIELGLKYVNNDACYPAMVVVGQFLQALKSGDFDPERTDCLYAQTGGACRASNYVPLLRKALDAAGFEHVRILAANAQANAGAEKFSIAPGTVWRSLLGMVYGDMLMKLLLATRPYEVAIGSTDGLYAKWAGLCKENVADGSWKRFKSDLSQMVRDFLALPVSSESKPKVGIVGEILVKYHANSNENLVRTIEEEGGEAVVPGISNFMLYCLLDPVFSHQKLSGGVLGRFAGELGIKVIERIKKPMFDALKGTRFEESHSIKAMARSVDGMVSHANQGGEGWLLTSEMMNLIESGVKNVLCIQPFACLPNHITGKGVIKELKRRYQGANILALDYDSSVSNVNQLNRIKLLMATAQA